MVGMGILWKLANDRPQLILRIIQTYKSLDGEFFKQFILMFCFIYITIIRVAKKPKNLEKFGI